MLNFRALCLPSLARLAMRITASIEQRQQPWQKRMASRRYICGCIHASWLGLPGSASAGLASACSSSSSSSSRRTKSTLLDARRVLLNARRVILAHEECSWRTKSALGAHEECSWTHEEQFGNAQRVILDARRVLLDGRDGVGASAQPRAEARQAVLQSPQASQATTILA